MVRRATNWQILRATLATPQIALARPSVNRFLYRYLKKFRMLDVDGNLIIHSHLPPLNSPAYARFVKEHLLAKIPGPSHAQIGVTSACPQHCTYCYNKDRTGRPLDQETILRTIRELQELGVFWLGLTGGEPLLNRDLPRIIEYASRNCAVKLFTTGSTLTQPLARDLRNAGLFSVAVSLDSWREEEHDRARGCKGAFRAALRAIELCKRIPGLHVSVSAVLPPGLLLRETAEQFLDFLHGLGIHEAWLSEAKPAVAACQKKELVITPEQRAMLMALQDRWNREDGMTVNYLGHFEDASHFGCSAGKKMVYVDAFGEVSPCVFIPMTFGNVQRTSLREIYPRMAARFPGENGCFINRNYRILQTFRPAGSPVIDAEATHVMDKITFGPQARFFELQYH